MNGLTIDNSIREYGYTKTGLPKKKLVYKDIVKIIIVPILILNIILGVILGCLCIGSKNRTDLLYSQQAAQRWGAGSDDYAQVSIFNSEESGLRYTDIKSIRGAVQKRLYYDSLIQTEAGEPTWYDAYSGHTFDTIRKDSTTVDVNIYTVGGDFFRIHQMPLKSGSYPDLSSSDTNQILLDEYTAWNLFGGSNIVGMKVWIRDAIFTVTGVVKCDDTYAARQAYGEYNAVYVPMEAYSNLLRSNAGSDMGSDNSDQSGSSLSSGTYDGTVATCYEMVLPNPIKNYGLNTVAEAAGIKFQTDEEKEKARSSLFFGSQEIIENSNRFSIPSLYNRSKEKKLESFKTNSIVYPYWENEARYEENKEIKVLRYGIVVCTILILSIVVVIYIIYRIIADVIAKKINKRHSVYE